ncbi:aminoglycoside 6'-N-acetyltransferase [Lysinibacillus sp. NPDC097287]|uniref:aminoglycoside 6'-N-acetyltransferase n=1 Tax=Lysinibacillus sp. NPDC097287 TaxID=3364144 RepID=UPI00382BA797
MIKQAVQEDTQIAAQLALLLWPNHTLSEFAEEMAEFIASESAAIFLAFQGTEAVGFAQCQLRTDYVEGTNSSPVGYLEGLFVKEGYRQHGFAKQLVTSCEQWAKTKGCKEFASDCELDNTESLAVHLKLGFSEANRIICFTKSL